MPDGVVRSLPAGTAGLLEASQMCKKSLRAGALLSRNVFLGMSFPHAPCGRTPQPTRKWIRQGLGWYKEDERGGCQTECLKSIKSSAWPSCVESLAIERFSPGLNGRVKGTEDSALHHIRLPAP